MIEDEIRNKLLSLQDRKYREMQRKIIPTLPADSIIGVRTPALRNYAKELGKREDIQDFLGRLPHRFFEENQLHAFIIAGIKDFDLCMAELEGFLPYIDNWASCDQLTPKSFRLQHGRLLEHIQRWTASDHPYTLRFAIKMLMDHFLDEDFDISYPEMVGKIKSEDYYVKMMVAWYFATALAKQYEAVLPFIEKRMLEPWTHNKAIQKSVESYRIKDGQKEYLKRLKI